MLRHHQQCDTHIDLTLRGIRTTIVVMKNTVNTTYSEGLSVDIFIQYAKRTRRITLPPVACLAILYISTLSHNEHDFGGKIVQHKMCFDSVYQFCLKRLAF
jgi:hypothetical protein